jgi:hypothetical protein
MAGMVRTTAPRAAVEQLAGYLLDRGRQDAITEELTEWLAGSARFRSFAELHRDKIRKKLRTAADAEALRDVRTELQAARLLLVDSSIELAFEAYGSGKVGPDLTVTYRGRRSFNLEVTRLRRVPDATDFGPPLLAKLRQLPPSLPNAVLTMRTSCVGLTSSGPRGRRLSFATSPRSTTRRPRRMNAWFALCGRSLRQPSSPRSTDRYGTRRASATQSLPLVTPGHAAYLGGQSTALARSP